MRKFIVILLILISIKGFSQVKEINPDEFEKLRLNKSLMYFKNGEFYSGHGQHRTPIIENKFKIIELDTTTFKLHITGQVFNNNNPSIDLTADINVGAIISEDSKETKMKFTHYFQTDGKGNYDITFIINNENSLLSFNGNERFKDIIISIFSGIYRVGELLR